MPSSLLVRQELANGARARAVQAYCNSCCGATGLFEHVPAWCVNVQHFFCINPLDRDAVLLSLARTGRSGHDHEVDENSLMELEREFKAKRASQAHRRRADKQSWEDAKFGPNDHEQSQAQLNPPHSPKHRSGHRDGESGSENSGDHCDALSFSGSDVCVHIAHANAAEEAGAEFSAARRASMNP